MYCCESLNKQSSGVQERVNPFYINSYGENSFCLRTFRFTNDLQERIKFVNRGLTVLKNELLSGYLRVVSVERCRRKRQLSRQLFLTTRSIITSRVRKVSSFPSKVCDLCCLIQVFLQQKLKSLYVILFLITSGFNNQKIAVVWNLSGF